jgi:hypothetical protein
MLSNAMIECLGLLVRNAMFAGSNLGSTRDRLI